MRAKTTRGLLEYEISKKPFLKTIHDQLDTMSLEDLEQVRFPIKWIRDEFLLMKRQRVAAALEAQSFANILDRIVEQDVVDPEGELILWVGLDETYLKVDRGNAINIREGRYLFMPLSGGVYNDNLFSRYVDPAIFTSGRPAGRSTLTAYKRLCADIRNQVAPLNAPVIDMTGSSQAKTGLGPLAAYGVRFS